VLCITARSICLCLQRGRIRGVLGYRMGQQFQMGSYPFHFHMAGEVPPDSYMTDNAVYASYWRGGAVGVTARHPAHVRTHVTVVVRLSFSRRASPHVQPCFRGVLVPWASTAFTIHGTHALTVSSNTAFHVAGSAFYIEDGAEERNRINGNFAGFVHPLGRVDTCDAIGSVFDAPTIYNSSTLLQPADWAAAGFYLRSVAVWRGAAWCTAYACLLPFTDICPSMRAIPCSNAYNYIENNAASGGTSGFMFLNLPLPIGVSAGYVMLVVCCMLLLPPVEVTSVPFPATPSDEPQRAAGAV
jgi:hypothetical protein